MEQVNLLESPGLKHIHFIGIGGISMSGLAEILLSQGFEVSGSDLKTSNLTNRLEKLGAKIYPGHSPDNIKDPDLIVYTAAVKESNPELAKARSLPVPVIDRAELLGQIMKTYPKNIAVAGTHGKTTTTSMVTMIMLQANLNPTVHIGGELQAIQGNTKIGSHSCFITEACEYVESFLKFHPYMAVILNIETDHLDYFKDLEHIKSSFLKFVSLVPQDGFVVLCIDDENTAWLSDKVSCNQITYGINSKEATWRGENIVYNPRGCASFNLIKDNEEMGSITLNVPGLHNVYNSLAAIASCYTLGANLTAIQEGLLKFTGTHRRFEVKGMANGVQVVDDYAHHPSEIKATLKAAKNSSYNKIWCVFQPHTYTRTKMLLDEFSMAFTDADTVILSDIYAAREKDLGEIHSQVLADKINAKENKALYFDHFDSIVEYLRENANPGDLIITMGAGDIYKVGEMFLVKKVIA